MHVIQYTAEWELPRFYKEITARNQGPARLAGIARPGDTIMVADAEAECGQEKGAGWAAVYCPIELRRGPYWYTDLCLDKTYALSRRHQEGGNYAMADGHTRWMRREAVLNASQEPGEEIWGHFEQ